MSSKDPAMARAFERARATLEEFFRVAASPREGTSRYEIKVPVSD